MPPTTDPSTPTTSTFRWLLDTRPLWREEPFEQSASRALSLLPPTERHTILKHIFTADRKLRLASFLLKRLAIHRTLRIPWSTITLSTDAHGKPCYVPPSPANTSCLPVSARSPDANDHEPDVVKFNVSHQAGLVVLIGTRDGAAEVGIDVVSVDERRGRDMAAVRKGGWGRWVDVYAEVFSEGEVEEVKGRLPGPVAVSVRDAVDGADDDGEGRERGMERTMTLSPTELVSLARCERPDVWLPLTLPRGVSANSADRETGRHGEGGTVLVDSTSLIASKIRNFYAHWCLKEAYIKMTGEALLAPWLRDLEFRNVRPPVAASGLSSTSVARSKEMGHGEGSKDGEEYRGGKGKWGETVDSESFEIYRCGERIGGRDGKLRVELTAWEEGFMIGSAVSLSGSISTTEGEREGKEMEFGDFEQLDLERDVLRVAEAGA